MVLGSASLKVEICVEDKNHRMYDSFHSAHDTRRWRIFEGLGLLQATYLEVVMTDQGKQGEAGKNQDAPRDALVQMCRYDRTTQLILHPSPFGTTTDLRN